jgi:hypothetical protein
MVVVHNCTKNDSEIKRRGRVKERKKDIANEKETDYKLTRKKSIKYNKEK